MYTEEYQHNGFFFRKMLLKLLLIVAIILLLIWIIPKFISYKPSNNTVKNDIKVTEKNINASDLNEKLLKLKDAAFLFYKKEKLPVEKTDVELVNLKQLKEEKLITSLDDSSSKCDVKKSYAKLTKLTDDYLMKVYIKCGSKSDYLLIHVGEYSYCNNTLCEKDLTKEKEEKSTESNEMKKETQKNSNVDEPTVKEEEQEESNETNKNTTTSNNGNQLSTIKLSAFSDWSQYSRTSCSTKSVECRENDSSCLTEVRLKNQTEQVGTYAKEYYTYSLVLNKKSDVKMYACSNYNYITIQNITYRTPGNYEEILSLGSKMSTSSWTYKGTISTTTTPNFGSNKYYKFIGGDFGNCGSTCTTAPSYYYEVYEYNKPMQKITVTTDDCNGASIGVKTINNYSIAKKKEVAKRQEPLYATACYQSTRTRKIIK